MNKKLLAISIGAAMVAGATAAIAADEPTIYAKIHLSVDSMDSGASAPNDSDGIFVSSNSSRLGIKGVVDLDGSLKAVYKYEMSTNYSTSKGGLAGNRNAYLGLKGGFGQVIAGRHDMPFKTVGRKHDLFGDTIGDHRAITRAKLDGDDYADRHDNVIMYTNEFGAVGLKVAYAPDEGKDDSEDLGIGITYKQGPLGIMFANETHGKGNLSAATLGTTPKDSTGNILAGSYGMSNITLTAGYLTISDVGGNDGLGASGFTLAGAMKAGMNTFKFQYTSAELDCTGCTDTASTLLAVGVDHKLGKKTMVYAVYAGISNEDAAGTAFSSTGHDGTVTASSISGDDPSGFSVGMVHKF